MQSLSLVNYFFLFQASIGPYIGVSIADMASGSIEAEVAVSVIHLVFLIIDPPYAVMGGMYYITRVCYFHNFLPAFLFLISFKTCLFSYVI